MRKEGRTAGMDSMEGMNSAGEGHTEKREPTGEGLFAQRAQAGRCPVGCGSGGRQKSAGKSAF